jgi:hypothetical protein
MRFTEFNEARRNPEQNPQVSINDTIINALNSTESTVANTKNLFVSFTTLDKLGINPNSKYSTPIGIYSYPAEYVVSVVGNDKDMKELPFAGESPYVNLFNASGNIINIATITSAETDRYYKALAVLLSKQLGTDLESAKLEVETSIYDSQDHARVQTDGGRFWYVMYTVSRELFAPKWKTRPAVAWNKLFRLLGIDGVIDFTPSGGKGIIHPSEPTQAVFFTSNSIKNPNRYYNKYSPAQGVRADRKAAGEKKHQNIINAKRALTAVKTAEEAVAYLRFKDPKYIRMIRSSTMKQQVLALNPKLIQGIQDPTPEEQRAALTADLGVIGMIEKPSEQMVLDILRKDSTHFLRVDDMLKKFPYPSEELQLHIVNFDPLALNKIKKPSDASIILALKKAYPIPSWMKTLATKRKIDISNQ